MFTNNLTGLPVADSIEVARDADKRARDTVPFGRSGARAGDAEMAYPLLESLRTLDPRRARTGAGFVRSRRKMFAMSTLTRGLQAHRVCRWCIDGRQVST